MTGSKATNINHVKFVSLMEIKMYKHLELSPAPLNKNISFLEKLFNLEIENKKTSFEEINHEKEGELTIEIPNMNLKKFLQGMKQTKIDHQKLQERMSHSEYTFNNNNKPYTTISIDSNEIRYRTTLRIGDKQSYAMFSIPNNKENFELISTTYQDVFEKPLK